MNLFLPKKAFPSSLEIRITGSKSETNRLLLLQALFDSISIENGSNSDDSTIMKNSLTTSSNEINIHHAGTAMRFLTAFFAISEGRNIILTGSQRMKERPISILVDSLRTLGAEIYYTVNEGFPPIEIRGKNLHSSEVNIQANVSSQYISALLLIGAKLKNGLKLNLIGKCTSLPYLQMTISLLQKIGVRTEFSRNTIQIFPQKELKPQTIVVESDWSSASYFYSTIALSKIGTEVILYSFKEKSLQGDSELVKIYENFGVKTFFLKDKILLRKEKQPLIDIFSFNFINCPDIAQTVAVTCFGLGIYCHFTGLHTLIIKETNRLEALKTELTKLGASVITTESEISIIPPSQITENVSIDTYQDHRMAMAFAPLSLLIPITINNAEVVSKSYPDFWKDFLRN